VEAAGIHWFINLNIKSMLPLHPLIANPLTHPIQIGPVTEQKLLQFINLQNNDEFKSLSHRVVNAAACGFAYFDIGNTVTLSLNDFICFSNWGVLYFSDNIFTLYPY
jgi:hypothetical protein